MEMIGVFNGEGVPAVAVQIRKGRVLSYDWHLRVYSGVKTTMDNHNVKAVLTPAEMAQADAAAIKAGTSGVALMAAAGQAVYSAVTQRFSQCRVLVVCGPGNNGGDGYVVARLLRDQGWPVSVASPDAALPVSPDALHHARLWQGDIHRLCAGLLDTADLVIDALFGAGLQRPLAEPVAGFVQALNRSQRPVCAIDLPSGVNGTTGQVLGNASVQARLTVTFFRKKPGHLLLPGRGLCGELVLADIGIPDVVLDTIVPATFENDPVLWLRDFPWPRSDGHKYHRGHTLVVGGQSMTGAARLAARAAARMGAGLVTVAAPVCAWSVYATALEAIMVSPYTDSASLQDIFSDARKNVLVVGPGAGAGGQTREHVRAALATRRRVVLDADALTAFASGPQVLFDALHPECVLTPHEGEFARLFPNLSEGGKLERARAAAIQAGAVVLLKGADTIIAAPDGRAVVNTNAPPWLATGGSGDVLTGLIAGLLSQGMNPLWAACAAVWLHGQAAAAVGLGLVAEDLPDRIPEVLQALYARTSLG